MWKYLTHPNILTLLGITTDPFHLISEWVSGGDLLQYVTNSPGADRLKLVGTHPLVYTALTSVASYPASLRASITCIPMT